jgi:hypothetical protein
MHYPRSPKILMGGMAHLGRFIDKIRLRHQGLIQDYNYITTGFDKYLIELLQIDPKAFERYVLQGGTDEELLAWVRMHGRAVTPDDLRQWNDRILHSGPKDDAARLRFQSRLAEIAAKRGTTVERLPRATTWVDVIELDEGRL